MKLRVTKRTRAEAALICDVAASLDEREDVTAERLACHLDVDFDSAEIADEACDAACLDSDCIGFEWRELWAEAAQRLR